MIAGEEVSKAELSESNGDSTLVKNHLNNDQIKDKSWGEPPSGTNQLISTVVRNAEGLRSWSHPNTQPLDASTSARTRSGRHGAGRRSKFTDVTDQLPFSTLRTQSWANQHLTAAHLHSSPLSGANSQRHNYPQSSHPLRSNNPVLTRSSNVGSAGMSSATMTQSALPYQTNAHTSMYPYLGQNLTRFSNSHPPYALCNGCNNTNKVGTTQQGNVQRSLGMNNRRNSVGSPNAALSLTNVYIRGLDPNTTDDDLRAMCARFGRISSTKAIMDKTTGQCKRYGFVDFEEASDARRAVDALNQEGKVQAQMAKQQEQDPTNLYLANLPPDYEEADLQKLLENYGSTISTRVLKNVDGSSRCVGFARMDNEALCARIIKDLNGKKVIEGSELPLMVKYADSNKKIRTRLSPAVSTLCSSLSQLDLNPLYIPSQYDHQLNNQYVRNNPTVSYIIPRNSPYVYQYPFISGFADAQLGSATSQIHGMAVHTANAVIPQHELMTLGGGSNIVTARTASASTVPQFLHHNIAFQYYPLLYSMQALDGNIGGAVVSAANPTTPYMPAATDLLMHTDVGQSQAGSIYAGQPPPPIQNSAVPSGIVTVSQ